MNPLPETWPDVRVVRQLPALTPTDALTLCLFEGERDKPLSPHAPELAAEILRENDFAGEADSSLFVRAPHGRGVLGFVGLGHRADDAHSALRRATATAVRAARQRGIQTLYLALPATGDDHDEEAAVQAATEGALLGCYENNFYQRREESGRPRLAGVRLLLAGEPRAGDEEALRRGRVVAGATNWARALADEPGAQLPPREFARRAGEMAREYGLKVETLDGAAIRERGMGGLWGVGQGSDEEPALIILRYEPPPAETVADGELWAFVGKGITFDTGGISIKPAAGMEEMKSDMAGGAAVLGALCAIAQLRPPRRVVGIVPSAENMPSGKALKPGDVIRTLAGYTIEVADTDAEGRLVLSDGLAYARQLGATRIVDLATLTGSIIVALGHHRAGLFSNHDAWAAEVIAASVRAGEPVWRMPVGDDYRKPIESQIADFKNYGGRPDATAAALLLSKFAGETPWVHLDIAGTAWYEEARPFAPKGASGAGVRTLVELTCPPEAPRPR